MNQSTDQPINRSTDLTRHDRSIAFLIVGFLLACYLLTYTGVIQSSDGLSMFATAESMVRTGQIDSNQLLWMGVQQGSFGPDGNLYGRKGLGMTLLTLPLVWMALSWRLLGLVQAALLLNPLLTAWTGGLVYRAGRRLGWSQQAAVITALVFGLATLAWPYTQTFFSDPVAGWGLFAALYALLAYDQTRRKRYLAVAGLAWGLAYLARSVNLVTLPLYALALLAILNRGASWRERLPDLFRRLIGEEWRAWTTFALPILAAGMASLWWNFARYGSIFDSGYMEAERFSANLAVGVFGLLIGPARGLIWYSPVLILAIPGARRLWREKSWLVGLSVAVSGVYVLLYGKWFMWHGGYSWGPRFLVPLMPFLALLTGPIWARVGAIETDRGWQNRATRGVVTLTVGFTVALSLAVQWLGMMVPFALVQDWLAANVQPLFAPATFSQIGYSPLVLQWRFLSPDNFIFAWWKAGRADGGVDWVGFALPLAGLLVGASLILRLVQTAQSDTLPTPELNGDRARNWLYSLALGLMAVAMLIHYQVPLSGQDNQAIAARIQAEEQPRDAILHLQALDTQAFANIYHGHNPVYGLLPQPTLTDDSAAWLARINTDQRRLWVVPDYAPPHASGWERALQQDAFLLLDERPGGRDGGRLALYALAGTAPLTETGLGTLFGQPGEPGGRALDETGWARLGGYAVTEEAAPGGEILLVLTWESLRPVAQDFNVFVHLLNQAGEKVAQRDGQPVLWQRPTSTWQPGQEILDRYGLLLPPDLAPGTYTLTVGLYDPVSGQRLPINAGPEDNAINLGPIVIE